MSRISHDKPINYRDKKSEFFIPGCKHVILAVKVNFLNIWVCEDWLTFEASLKWSFRELQLWHFAHLSNECICYIDY